MKLFDVAMAIEHHDQKVLVVSDKSGRCCFEGTADELLDYSGIDYRRVTSISVKDGVLKLRTKVTGE